MGYVTLGFRACYISRIHVFKPFPLQDSWDIVLLCFGARAYVLKQIIMFVGTRGFGRVGYTLITMKCSTFQRKIIILLFWRFHFKKEIFQNILKHYLVAFTHPKKETKKEQKCVENFNISEHNIISFELAIVQWYKLV